MASLTETQLAELVNRLRRLPRETEWVEFKQNLAPPEDIGQYLSALANSAALADQPAGYLVWGIEDSTHAITGTAFDPFAIRIGNELLEGWLNRLVEPHIAFAFARGVVASSRMVCSRFRGLWRSRCGSRVKPMSELDRTGRS